MKLQRRTCHLERRVAAQQQPTAITFVAYDETTDEFVLSAEVMGELHEITLSSKGLLAAHLCAPGTVLSMAVKYVVDHPTEDHPRILVGMKFVDRRRLH